MAEQQSSCIEGASVPSFQRPELLVTRGDGESFVHRLDPPPYEAHLGRSRINEIVVPDPQVSARHLKLVWTAEGVFVEDCDSRHGTQLNGQPVRSGQRLSLADGDELRFGGSSARFVSYEDRLARLFEPERMPVTDEDQGHQAGVCEAHAQRVSSEASRVQRSSTNEDEAAASLPPRSATPASEHASSSSASSGASDNPEETSDMSREKHEAEARSDRRPRGLWLWPVVMLVFVAAFALFWATVVAAHPK